jgi:hypothetical protein
MAQPEIQNKTPFAFEPLFMNDEVGRPIMVPVVKATFSIDKDRLVFTPEDQTPVNVSGEYRGDPETSSYKYEPEIAFSKPSTDVVLIGSARTSQSGSTEIHVGFQIGSITKVVRVVGNRIWEKNLGIITMTDPEPFEMMPLIYENSFGGWDRSKGTPQTHSFDPRNPVGTGYRDKDTRFDEGIRLPNLEDPIQPIQNFGDRPRPAGFGFVSPHWQPRAGLAGTYDEAWQKERMPLLPEDFDRRFFNAAPPDQVASGYLKGDEPVIVTNASKTGRIAFNLPGVEPPSCTAMLKQNRFYDLRTQLDTVIINSDENRVFLIWRTHMALKNGPQDVARIQIYSDTSSGAMDIFVKRG